MLILAVYIGFFRDANGITYNKKNLHAKKLKLLRLIALRFYYLQYDFMIIQLFFKVYYNNYFIHDFTYDSYKETWYWEAYY